MVDLPSLAISFLHTAQRSESHEKIPKKSAESHMPARYCGCGTTPSVEKSTEALSAIDFLHASWDWEIGQAFYVAKYARKHACPKVAKQPKNRNPIPGRQSREPFRRKGEPPAELRSLQELLAYRWGHREIVPRKKVAGCPTTGRTLNSHDSCRVLICDRFPAYITWYEFKNNQQTLAEHSALGKLLSAPQHGPSVLAGLVVCGRCSHRMLVGCNKHGGSVEFKDTALQLPRGDWQDQEGARGVIEKLGQNFCRLKVLFRDSTYVRSGLSSPWGLGFHGHERMPPRLSDASRDGRSASTVRAQPAPTDQRCPLRWTAG
jgi:hypothetical protein